MVKIVEKMFEAVHGKATDSELLFSVVLCKFGRIF